MTPPAGNGPASVAQTAPPVQAPAEPLGQTSQPDHPTPAGQMGQAGHAASIKEVSRAAGVSISTVSHVLNGTRFVSDDLRRRVEAAIAQLDYRHNGLARSLRTRQTYAIGLIIPDVANPYYPQIARGVQDAAAEAGYWVFLCNSDRNTGAEARLLDALEQRRVDGIILDPSGPDPALLAALRRSAAPVVLVGSRIDVPDLDVVTVAPNGSHDAVCHLVALGHRRIALIAGPPAPGGALPAKARGYRLALEEAGISPDPALVVEGDYTREGGAAAMERLLALPQPPTAVFAGNDLMAIGALAAARHAGRRIPQDIAVVGYDDIPEAAVTTPTLSTVAVPKYDMGHAAASVLLDRLRARSAHTSSTSGGTAPLPVPQRIVLPYRLVIRQST
jgi:LacI family transcriptional regulator